MSTTRGRAEHAIFRRDNGTQLLVDDCTGYRAVLARGTVEVRPARSLHNRITQDLYQHVRRQAHQDAAEKMVALLPDLKHAKDTRS